MERRRADWRRSWLLRFFNLCISFLLVCPLTTTADTLDVVIRDYAQRVRAPTGILLPVPLPANLSGVEAFVVRLRAGTVWARGANFSAFRIAPRTAVMPYTRRLLVVYQNLGNQSSAYYHPAGRSYALVSPIVALLAYDNIANKTAIGPPPELQLIPFGEPITVRFIANISYNPAARCSLLGPDGSVTTGVLPVQGACTVFHQGHYAIVEPVPLSPTQAPAPTPAPAVVAGESGSRRERKEWRWLWVAAGGGVAVGLVGATLVVFGLVRWMRRRKMRAMIWRAEDGVTLERAWVRGSKMPVAGAVRTKPVLETREGR